MTTSTFPHVIPYCLQVLNSYPAGASLYILACLCPKDIAVLELVRLDLSQPHRHEQFPEKDVRLSTYSDEDLLSQLRMHTSIVPAKDYLDFWLELARRWLLTCPADPDYCPDDGTGEDVFCRRLRSDLVDRILNLT